MWLAANWAIGGFYCDAVAQGWAGPAGIGYGKAQTGRLYCRAQYSAPGVIMAPGQLGGYIA